VRGASREALAEASERLDAELASADDAAVTDTSAELLSVARLLSEETGLARALADAGTDSATRVALLTTLFESRVGARSFAVLRAAASSRWSSARDLVDGVEILGAQAAFEEARRSESLDEVEDELFRFARIVERAPTLGSALSDPVLPIDNKRDLVHSLLAGKASPVTVQLVESVVLAPRGRTTVHAVDSLANQAAQRRQREIAVVRVAAPLDDELKERLAAAIGRALGRDVRLQIEVDPSVVGGIVVQVGDEVIDGSISRRLTQAHRGLTA
jgi:F-type H+-transporting ATPase subunit delta